MGEHISFEGSRSLKAFFVEGRPVGDASVEKPDVDVVEVVGRIDPFAAAVVDHKIEVFGRTWPEGRGEIGSWVGASK